jgi:hypothetical protein
MLIAVVTGQGVQAAAQIHRVRIAGRDGTVKQPLLSMQNRCRVGR